MSLKLTFVSSERKDHVNELGLPNDGYDYEQHLKPIGMCMIPL